MERHKHFRDNSRKSEKSDTATMNDNILSNSYLSTSEVQIHGSQTSTYVGRGEKRIYESAQTKMGK